MQNFETIIQMLKRSLKSVRGIFDKNNIESKVRDLENYFWKKIFGKIKILLKNYKTKKIFDEILNSYQNQLVK